MELGVKAWIAEKKDYTLKTAACTGVCGHYTQVVWDKTREVGCAVVKDNCVTHQASYLACNYQPASVSYLPPSLSRITQAFSGDTCFSAATLVFQRQHLSVAAVRTDGEGGVLLPGQKDLLSSFPRQAGGSHDPTSDRSIWQ